MTFLTTLTDTAPSRAGAKAAALSRLQQAGLPVPDSAIIPVNVTDSDLPGAAAQVLAWAEHRAPYGLIARSSAPGEDGVTSSFAGLYDSVITPCAPGQVLAALRQVRASVRAPVVTEYAAARGLSPDDDLAVLVQPVLRPVAAGVLAAQVTSGRCVHWRIEAVRGLAEQLVSGAQTGEIHCGRGAAVESVATCVQPLIHLPGTAQELDLPPGEWITVSAAAGAAPARAKVAGSSCGVMHLRAPAEWADVPVLTPRGREELLDLAARAAQALGLEQIDMEWAATVDGPTVLQGRPLTQPIRDVARREPPTGGWAGLAAVAGIATGPAVRLGPDPAPEGAVLICGALGPEAATALLRSPAAVVSTTGGPLSHTAIIARELGIPCVTNVPEAADIAAGTVIEVDGTAGTVRPAPFIPSPRQEDEPVSYRDAAVLTTRIPDARADDGRVATLLLHDPDCADLGVLVRAVTTASDASGSLGILLPDGPPPSSVLLPEHPGLELRTAGGLALLWPQSVGDLPRRVIALDAEGRVIFARPLHTTRSSA